MRSDTKAKGSSSAAAACLLSTAKLEYRLQRSCRADEPKFSESHDGARRKQGQLRLSPVSLDCGSGVAVVRPSGGLPVE
jgi:hypothetical protein